MDLCLLNRRELFVAGQHDSVDSPNLQMVVVSCYWASPTTNVDLQSEIVLLLEGLALRLVDTFHSCHTPPVLLVAFPIIVSETKTMQLMLYGLSNIFLRYLLNTLIGHGSFDYDFKHKIDYKWDHNNSIHRCEVTPFGKIMYTCSLLVLPM